MSDTSGQEPKSKEYAQLVKLSRMLRSTLRSYPKASLLSIPDGFGVALDAQTSLRVFFNGHWTSADIRDLLVLFAVWLVVDPQRLMFGGRPLAGVLREELPELGQSFGRQSSPE